MGPQQHVTILGAGLTGLVAAYRLSAALPSTRITLLEASDRLGGWIRSDAARVALPGGRPNGIGGKENVGREVELVLEAGPRSIRPRGSRGAAGMLRLLVIRAHSQIRDLGLEGSIIPIPTTHPAARHRYLLDPATHKLTVLPNGLKSILGRQSPLLRGLLPSILSEPFRRRKRDTTQPGPSAVPVSSKSPNDGSSATLPQNNHSYGDDESVDSFFRRRFGPSIADNLASSMVHGIYAASSKDLSVRSSFPVLWDAEEKYGSVVLGMLGGLKSREDRRAEQAEWDELGGLGMRREGWSMYGLKGGLSTLVRRLGEEVEKRGVQIRMGEAAQAVRVDEDQVTVTTSQSTHNFDHVVSALLPSRLGPLLDPSSFPAHDLLLSNSSTSVGVINLVFPLPQAKIHPPGFGYLIPRSEGYLNPEGVLGVIFDSTAIPMGEDGGLTKLTVMMGGPWWGSYRGARGTNAAGTPSPTSSTSLSTESADPISRPAHPSELVGPALSHLRKVFPHLIGVDPILARPHLHLDCIPTYIPGHGSRMRALHEAMTSSHHPWRGRLSLVGNGYGGVGVNDCVASAEGVVRRLVEEDPAAVTGLEGFGSWC